MHRFIAAERADHSVSTLCRVLEVSPSGYYASQRRGRPTWRVDRPRAQAKPPHLRRSPDSYPAHPPRRADRQKAGGAADGGTTAIRLGAEAQGQDDSEPGIAEASPRPDLRARWNHAAQNRPHRCRNPSSYGRSPSPLDRRCYAMQAKDHVLPELRCLSIRLSAAIEAPMGTTPWGDLRQRSSASACPRSPAQKLLWFGWCVLMGGTASIPTAGDRIRSPCPVQSALVTVAVTHDIRSSSSGILAQRS